MFRRVALFSLLLSLLPIDARAQTDHDNGLWLMVFAQGDLDDVHEDLRDFRWWFDLQPRYTDDANGLEQLLVRPGLGYAFADNATAWAGYAWIQTDIGARNSYEHRIWQQLTWSPEIESFNLLTRTRLEQRFLNTGSETGWRFRQFVKATVPLPVPKFALAAWDEVFFDLNDTDWGQRAGFAQNRAFFGFDYRLGDGPATVEIGYLNQFTERRGRADGMNHILSINLLLSF